MERNEKSVHFPIFFLFFPNLRRFLRKASSNNMVHENVHDFVVDCTNTEIIKMNVKMNKERRSFSAQNEWPFLFSLNKRHSNEQSFLFFQKERKERERNHVTDDNQDDKITHASSYSSLAALLYVFV